MKTQTRKVYHKWTATELKQLRSLWAQGMDDEKIGSMLGRTRDGVRNQRHLKGMVSHKRSQSQRTGAKYTKYVPSKRSFSVLWGALKIEF